MCPPSRCFYFEIAVIQNGEFNREPLNRISPAWALILKLRLYNGGFYCETPAVRVLFTCAAPPVPQTQDRPPDSDADYERCPSACVRAGPRPLPGLALRGAADPASRPGGPGRPLRRAPVRLGLHGDHLQPPAGGGAAVLQRVLGERRAPGLQLRGSLHVPDPHGDLRAGPAGEPPGVSVHVSGSDRLLQTGGLRPAESSLRPHHLVWICAPGERHRGPVCEEGSVQSTPGDD